MDTDFIVLRSAAKHGVDASDARHAVRNAIRIWELGEGVLMCVGLSRNGALLEVGVTVDALGQRRIVHAMTARSKFTKGI